MSKKIPPEKPISEMEMQRIMERERNRYIYRNMIARVAQEIWERKRTAVLEAQQGGLEGRAPEDYADK